MADIASAPEWPNPYAPPSAQELTPDAGPLSIETLEPAGFKRRAAARLLDLGFHILIGFAAGIFVAFMLGVIAALQGIPFETLQAGWQPAQSASWVSGILGSMLFQVIAEGWHGSSPGKRLLGLVVLGEDARPCSPLKALKRELGYFIDALLFGAVAAHNMSEENRQQRLGDSWAGTLVVFRRSAPPRSLRSGLRFFTVGFVASAADAMVLLVPFLLRGLSV